MPGLITYQSPLLDQWASQPSSGSTTPTPLQSQPDFHSITNTEISEPPRFEIYEEAETYIKSHIKPAVESFDPPDKTQARRRVPNVTQGMSADSKDLFYAELDKYLHKFKPLTIENHDDAYEYIKEHYPNLEEVEEFLHIASDSNPDISTHGDTYDDIPISMLSILIEGAKQYKDELIRATTPSPEWFSGIQLTFAPLINQTEIDELLRPRASLQNPARIRTIDVVQNENSAALYLANLARDLPYPQ